MCGRARYSTLASKRIKEVTGGRHAPTYRQAAPSAEASSDHLPSTSLEDRTMENVSPGSSLPVILLNQDDGNYVIDVMKWGLIPHYAAKEDKPDHFYLFNKRVESFSHSHKYFDKLVESKRCVVILDGFYEWKGSPGHKQPYYVHLMGDQAMILPAIYEETTLTDPDTRSSYTIRSFAVLTGEPSNQFRSVHDRQPVIINEQQMRQWLDPNESVHEILEAFKENAKNERFQDLCKIQFYPVTKKMTNPKYQQTDCIVPVKLSSDVMSSFFVKKPANDKKGDINDVKEMDNRLVGKRSPSPGRSRSPSPKRLAKL